MGLVHERSLAETLDEINDALFTGAKLSKADRAGAARWIAARAGVPGSYEMMPAPTADDFTNGFRVFTGERFKSWAGTACKLGSEACRALILLEAGGAAAEKALAAAREAMSARMREYGAYGRYCCGSCAVATWRSALAGGLEKPDRVIAEGIRELKKARDEKGGWRAFPFWYTLLALTEVDGAAARAEKRHSAARCERLLARKPRGDRYDSRRRTVAERILAQV